MKQGLWVGLVALFMATGILAQPASTAGPIAGKSISINQKKIELESPLVEFDGLVFIPLRQAVKLLDASTVYLRKDDAFRIQVPSMNVPLLVAPNSAEIWVGTEQGYFSKKTFFKDGQFYVPLEGFFKFARYSVLRTPSGYDIRKNQPAPVVRSKPLVALPVKPTDSQKMSTVSPKVSTGSPKISVVLPKVSTASYKVSTSGVVVTTPKPSPMAEADIPIPGIGTPLSIAFGAQVYSVDGKFLISKGSLYVDMAAIFDEEGITMVRRPTYAELIIGAKTYRFSTESSDVRMTSGGQVETRGIGAPLLIKSGVMYFPLKGLAAALGYGVVWDGSAKRIQFLTRIHEISIVRKGGGLKAIILANRPVTAAQPIALSREPGFSVDLVDSQLAFPAGVYEATDSMIKWIEVRQLSPSKVRFSAVLKSAGGVSHVLPLAAGGEMVLSNRVTRVTGHAEGSDWVVKVEGEGIISPRVWGIPSPSMAIVVDIPNSFSMLPMAIKPEADAPYEMIRTSQFSLDPASTRIVLDMNENSKFVFRAVSPSAFEVVLSAKSAASAVVTRNISATPNAKSDEKPSKISSAAIKEVSRVRQATISKPSSRRLLARKIIVIDPGHGGNDPGAIAGDGSYEKVYTLDISNRLKALLEAEGATVLMCRSKDENPSLQDRCDFANNNNADVMLSVHINSFFHSYASGSETYYYKPTDKPLAAYVHSELVSALGFRDNGLKRARLYVLRNTQMPAMLIEPGFLTNPMEFEQFSRPEVRQKIAQAVAKGTIRFLGEYDN